MLNCLGLFIREFLLHISTHLEYFSEFFYYVMSQDKCYTVKITRACTKRKFWFTETKNLKRFSKYMLMVIVWTSINKKYWKKRNVANLGISFRFLGFFCYLNGCKMNRNSNFDLILVQTRIKWRVGSLGPFFSFHFFCQLDNKETKNKYRSVAVSLFGSIVFFLVSLRKLYEWSKLGNFLTSGPRHPKHPKASASGHNSLRISA